MGEFTIFDGGVAVIIVLSAILAYSRGFVREALAIAGWIGATILAYLFAPKAEPLVGEIVSKIPGVSSFIDNCAATTMTAFFAVFAICLVAFALFTPLFSSLVQRSALNGLDQGLGFFYGALRGMLLVAIALVVYDFVAGSEAFGPVDNSQAAKIFASVKGQITGELADQETALAWLTERFNGLISSCGATPPASN